MKNPEVEKLLMKYHTGVCTEGERILVELYFIQNTGASLSDRELEKISAEGIASIKARTRFPKQNTNLWSKIAITTAAVLILIGIWILIFVKTPLPPNYANDVNPGTSKASLTLANGKTIDLSKVKQGDLAIDEGVTITKTADGELLYRFNPDAISANSDQKGSITLLVSSTEASSNRLAGQNTLTTPHGGQYHIALPDGTKVWLNAGSVLRFPSTFQGLAERRVQLIGEAYFEVSQIKTVVGQQKPTKKTPFIVKTDKQEVTVLGTHFNINSYTDEPNTKTTLLEGSVSISSPLIEATILKPNDQAINNGTGISVKKVDTDLAIAWKNGEFAFRNEPLESIMRKVARWYNVEIHYKNNTIRNKLFGGSISKFGKVSEVLCMLELTGKVKFKIEGRRITVD